MDVLQQSLPATGTTTEQPVDSDLQPGKQPMDGNEKAGPKDVRVQDMKEQQTVAWLDQPLHTR